MVIKSMVSNTHPALSKPILVLVMAMAAIVASCSSHPDESTVKSNRPPLRHLQDKCLFVRGDLKDEREHGLWEYFYSDTTLHSKGEYDHGTRVGHWEFYSVDGILTESGSYWSNDSLILQNFKADSIEMEAHERLFKSSQAPKYAGDEGIWGVCPADTSGFDDFEGGDDFGGVEFGPFLVRVNIKHGPWYAYNEKGELLEIQFYEMGDLVSTQKMKAE